MRLTDYGSRRLAVPSEWEREAVDRHSEFVGEPVAWRRELSAKRRSIGDGREVRMSGRMVPYGDDVACSDLAELIPERNSTSVTSVTA